MKKIYFLCFLVLFAIQNTNAQKTENYLTNANFETWGSANSLTSWSLTSTAGSSSITQETTTVISNSTNSIKYIPTVANQGVLGNASEITIDTAGRYFFGIWMKTDADAEIKTGIKVVRSGSNIYSANTYTAPDTEWHYVVFYYDFLVGDQVTCRLVPQANGLTTFYLDDASLNEGIAGGNVEWDATNGTARTYDIFWGTQNYGGSLNGTLTENTDASYVKSGYNSLSLVTSADASSAKRGVIVLKDNNTLELRYVHPATTRKYQASAWVYTKGDADVVLNTKTGSTNNFSNHSIIANTWTQIFSSIITLDATDDGDKVYPIIQFKTPSTTHYVDDVYLNWDGIKWEGGTSSDWDTASNWSSNMVPNSASEITIPSGLSNYPTAASAVTVSSVDMAAGTSLISTSTFSGTVKYTRTLATENWYLMSSPVVGETYDNAYVTANGIASGTQNTSSRGIATYVTTDDSWDYMLAGETATFSAGTGYSVKRSSAGDVSFTGTLNVDNAGVDVVLSSTGNRFNLLGNPYTSHIASATFLANEGAVSETQTLWVWNQGSGSGAYEVKTLGEAMVIAPAQGFFVKANAAGGTFNFTESNQASSGGTFQRTDTRPEIYLTISNQTDARIAKVYYIDDMTTGFDVGYEGELFNGVSNPLAIYTHLVADSEGKNYQVQSLPPNNYENMIVPVGINAVSGSDITIDASTNNFPSGINIYLEDKQDNSFTLLEADSNFSFTPENNLSGIGRFYLHTTSGVLSADDFDINKNISIYTSSNDNLRIVGVQNGTATVRLYNILGKEMLKTSFEGNGVNDINLNTIPMGIYIVKLTTENGVLNRKIIIQ